MGLFRGKVKNYLKQVFLERERGILQSFAQGMARELFNSINYFSIIAQVIIVSSISSNLFMHQRTWTWSWVHTSLDQP